MLPERFAQCVYLRTDHESKKEVVEHTAVTPVNTVADQHPTSPASLGEIEPKKLVTKTDHAKKAPAPNFVHAKKVEYKVKGANARVTASTTAILKQGTLSELFTKLSATSVQRPISRPIELFESDHVHLGGPGLVARQPGTWMTANVHIITYRIYLFLFVILFIATFTSL